MLPREVKLKLYERAVIPTVVYGLEKNRSTWDDVFEEHMGHKENGQRKKLTSKREERV